MFGTKKMITMALFIALNVILGYVVSMLKIPFVYLDTLGTVYIAAVFGPLAGVVVGILTNVILAITTSGGVATVLFGLVNAAVAVVSGLMFKKFGVNYITAIIAGILLAFIAPAIGTPIALYFYGGLDGNASDFVKVYFNKLIDSFALSVYLEKVLNNFIDKILTCVLAVFLYKNINKRMNYEQK